MAQFSPTKVKTETLDFYGALKEMVAGNKVTKLEWDNPEIVGWLDVTLFFKDADGKTHQWILNDADILGMDWVVV